LVWLLLLEQRTELRLQNENEVYEAVFDPSSRQILTLANGQVHLWSGADGKLVWTLKDTAPIRRMYLLKKTDEIWTLAADMSVRTWSTTDGKTKRERIVISSVEAVYPSPNGQLLAATATNALWILDGETGHIRYGPLTQEQPIWNASFSPNGRRIVVISYDNAAHLWDPATGMRVGQPLRHNSNVSSAVFSPDSTRLVTTGRDKLAKIWNVENGEIVHAELIHKAEVEAGVFSADSRLLATICNDRTVAIWNVQTGLPETPALVHPAPVVAVAFDPRARRLATASEDHTVRLWDVAGGFSISEPLVHPNTVTALSFSPTGDTLLTGCADGVARVWAVPSVAGAVPDWLLDFAELLAGRKLDAHAVSHPVEREPIGQWASRVGPDFTGSSFSRWVERFRD
jgi:WD40 repeat protein